MKKSNMGWNWDQFFRKDSACAFFDCGKNKVMAVHGITLDGYKQGAWLDGAGISRDLPNLTVSAWFGQAKNFRDFIGVPEHIGSIADVVQIKKPRLKIKQGFFRIFS